MTRLFAALFALCLALPVTTSMVWAQTTPNAAQPTPDDRARQ
jgi:hypothetical protein